jgi:hypothetical protein
MSAVACQINCLLIQLSLMKQFVATPLLLGYVMLVPFCFFGGTLVANADTMNMLGSAAHQMDDCGMPLGGCANEVGSGGMDTTSHHVSMYNSITQTPLMDFSIVLTALVSILLIVFSLGSNWLSTLFSQVAIRPRIQRTEEVANTTRTSVLNWLSLFENSPNFA